VGLEATSGAAKLPPLWPSFSLAGAANLLAVSLIFIMVAKIEHPETGNAGRQKAGDRMIFLILGIAGALITSFIARSLYVKAAAEHRPVESRKTFGGVVPVWVSLLYLADRASLDFPPSSGRVSECGASHGAGDSALISYRTARHIRSVHLVNQ
jgi:hypothetical protein